MKKIFVAFTFIVSMLTLAFLGGMLGSRLTVHAQTPVALQLTGNAPHTSCTVTASQTTYCLASDGFYWSNTGAAYALWTGGATSGVSSITVCNAAGSSCGSAQTGAVSLSIPKSATTTVTVSAPSATATTTVN